MDVECDHSKRQITSNIALYHEQCLLCGEVLRHREGHLEKSTHPPFQCSPWCRMENDCPELEE